MDGRLSALIFNQQEPHATDQRAMWVGDILRPRLVLFHALGTSD